MPKYRIITAVDIGTSTIKALQIRENTKGDEPELFSMTKIASDGVRKGIVENIRKVAEKLTLAIDELQRMNSQEIRGIFANVGGGHMFVVRSKGEIAVSRADHEISQEDVERVLQIAQTFSLPPNREILEAWPQSYIVDQEAGIREPVGMRGMRLGVEILALCGFSPYLKNVEDAIVQAGVQLFDVIPSPIAASRAVLDPKQKELGCALVGIGARTTDLAVFEEGELVHARIFPVGSANITDDIAIGLRVSADEAEQIKLRFGISDSEWRGKRKRKESSAKRIRKKYRRREKNRESGGGDSLDFSRRELAKIVRARVCDIFDAIRNELKLSPSGGRLPGGIILCGGGAQLPHILELAKQEFRVPCSIGFPHGIAGLEQDPSLAVVAGLALEGLSEGRGEMISKGKRGGLGGRLKEWLRAFIP